MRILRIPHGLYTDLRKHVLPADGREALAFVLCGRREGDSRQVLLAHELHVVPHDLCRRRERDLLVWPTEWLIPVLERGARLGLSLLRVHSHPGGFEGFSHADDTTDRDVFPFASAYLDRAPWHASAVMVPTGKLVGRFVMPNGSLRSLDRVSLAGDRLVFMDRESAPESDAAFEGVGRQTQVLGLATRRALRSLTVAVVGCSGTGSHVIEQLGRLGVGELVLVDPERVERKNLNRIVGATRADADEQLLKVEVARRNVESMGLGTRVTTIADDLRSARSILAVAESDVVFGCMDGIAGRHILGRLSSYYCLPYFDLGVLVEATPEGGIRDMQATAHYLQPGCSTLESRGVYGAAALERDALARYSPSAFQERVREGYIRGAVVEQPAVVSINSTAAGLAVSDFLLRLHGVRRTPDREVAEQRLLFLEGAMLTEGESGPRTDPSLALGDCDPLLGLA